MNKSHNIPLIYEEWITFKTTDTLSVTIHTSSGNWPCDPIDDDDDDDDDDRSL